MPQLVQREVIFALALCTYLNTINFILSYKAALGHGHSQAPFPHEESTEPLFFKLLCPQGVTGLIIGKGGANIIQLNTTTGARIKLSQNNEYFPNTSDRILLSKSYLLCRICGRINNVMNIFSLWGPRGNAKCRSRASHQNC